MFKHVPLEVTLTHIRLVSCLWDIGKQCKTRADAVKRGVWSDSPVFAYRSFFWNLNKNAKYHPATLKWKQIRPVDTDGARGGGGRAAHSA